MPQITTANTARHCRCTNSSRNDTCAVRWSIMAVVMFLSVAVLLLALRSSRDEFHQIVFSFFFISTLAFIAGSCMLVARRMFTVYSCCVLISRSILAQNFWSGSVDHAREAGFRKLAELQRAVEWRRRPGVSIRHHRVHLCKNR